MDYRVSLDIYKGPLDLLLYLIRENEVEITDIPIATITEQYMKYIDIIRMMDPNIAGDFLVMASTLMEIKSHSLLPKAETEAVDEDEGDPRIELIRQLMEYKRFKEAASALAEKREEYLERFGRGAKQTFDDENADDAELELGEVSIWDVLSAFDRVMRETLRLKPATIVDHDVPVRQHVERILAMLRVAEIFEDCEDRVEAMGAFLALLEMTRAKVIALEQTDTHGMITVRLLDESNVDNLLLDVLDADEARARAAAQALAGEVTPEAEAPEPGAETADEEELLPEMEGALADADDEGDEDDEDLVSIRGIEVHDVILSTDENTPESADDDAADETNEAQTTEPGGAS